MPDRAQIARVCCAIAGTAAVPLLWSMGLVGGGKYDEHVANWDVAIYGRDGDGLLVSETIAVDFGNERRSGMDRVIDHGLGVPDKVYGLPRELVPDPAAPGPGAQIVSILSEQSLDVTEATTLAHLRTERGRSTGVQYLTARYVLPTAPQIGERFEYELIPGGRSVDADDVYVFLDGMAIESPTCRRASGAACEVRTENGYYAVELSSLPAGDSLTIGGTVTGWTEWVELPDREWAEPRVVPSGERWVQWILALPMAVLGWNLAALRWRRRCAAVWSRPSALDARVDDAANGLAGLPTFSSWKSSALVHHELGLSSAAAWFAEQVANGVLTLETVKGTLMLRRGPHFDEAGLEMRDELHRLFGRNDCVALDPNERRTKRAIRVVRDRQAAALQEHRWWRRFAPRGGDWFSAEVAAVFVAWAAVLAVLIATNWSYSWPVAIALLIVVPASTNAAVAWWMAPQLGLEGEDAVVALAPLRRMLRNADTSHVEAAHQAGLLPQYSAWAVALDAANRWRDAVLAADLSGDDAATALAPLEMGRNGGPWSLAADFPSNELRPPLRPQPADA